MGRVAGNGHDIGQHAIEPRHEPFGALGKQALHVDRDVQR